MTLTTIPLHLLDQDDRNSRKQYTGISLLADSIAAGGLLENLGVVASKDGRYLVKFGNRRLKAMKLLVNERRLPVDFPVECRILEGDGVLAAGIENIAREDLRPWEVGNHYLLLAEKGLGQKEIAACHAKSQQHVSQCIRIARDLSPVIIDRLSLLSRSDCPNILELTRIAEHRDRDTLGPDVDKQIAALDKLLGIKKERAARAPSEKRQQKIDLMTRLDNFFESKFPRHAAPYMRAVIRFLRGETDALAFPNAPEPRGERRAARTPSARKKKASFRRSHAAR